jgi:sugar phosphate permease
MSSSIETIASPAKSSGRGFGGWGWAMILYSVVMYFAYAGWSADGLNIFVPALGKAHGWDAATLLSLVTPGGLFGVVGSAFFGQVIIKRGARFVFVLCLVFMAFTVFWFGRMSSLWEFTVTFILLNFFGVGFGFIATGTLMTTWFPRKKGLALGIATMGFPLATAVFVPLIAFMFGQMGIPVATSVWCVILLIVAVVGFFLIKDNPEKIGCYPDNEPISAAEIKANLDELNNYVSTFTVKKLLRDKEMWLISIGWGALWLVTTGIVVQMVPRMTSIGYSLSHAIALLSIAAVCAIPGSLLWGWLDQKFGPRFASVVYALLYIATLLLLIFQTSNTVITFFTVVCVGLGLGGIKNLITSIIGTVYGRYDFTAANRMIMPISIIVRTLAFVVMGVTLAAFKTLSAAYASFIVVDIIAIFLIIATNATCKGKSL